MRFIKGFANIPSLANNTANTVAAVGELSEYSSSFSREKGKFGSTSLGDVEFISFSARNDAGDISTTPNDIGNEIATALNWIYTKAVAGQLGDDEADNAEAIAAFFSSYADVSVGEIVSGDLFSIPSWVSWTSANSGDAYYTKIWFVDAAFRGQYDEFEIEIVPPITPIDGFFNNYNTVQTLLAGENVTSIIAKVNVVTNQFPSTALKTTSINWLSNGNANNFLPTVWTAVVWGPYGLNITNQKAAIVKYILAHSVHTETEWRVLMPSLFISTEFIITPHWDRYSVPNQTEVTGLYSSVFTPQQIITYAQQTRGNYPENFVQTAVRGATSPYKAIGFSVVGNPDNTDGISTFNAKFPDYIPVPSTSLDFARMQLRTQQWATLLGNMLPIAESMNTLSSLPEGMTRVWRGGIMFLAASHEEVLYLVCTKYFFLNP